jgi:hypothetical protein
VGKTTSGDRVRAAATLLAVVWGSGTGSATAQRCIIHGRAAPIESEVIDADGRRFPVYARAHRWRAVVTGRRTAFAIESYLHFVSVAHVNRIEPAIRSATTYRCFVHESHRPPIQPLAPIGRSARVATVRAGTHATITVGAPVFASQTSTEPWARVMGSESVEVDFDGGWAIIRSMPGVHSNEAVFWVRSTDLQPHVWLGHGLRMSVDPDGMHGEVRAVDDGSEAHTRGFQIGDRIHPRGLSYWNRYPHLPGRIRVVRGSAVMRL